MKPLIMPELSISSGTVVYYSRVWAHNAGVVSSNPASVAITTQWVRRTTGSHLIKSTSLEKTQRQGSLVSATLEDEC